jgi:molybdate transport system substrate-binding protein
LPRHIAQALHFARSSDQKLDVVLSASSDGGLEKSMPCSFVTGIWRSAAVAMWLATGVAFFLWTPADAAEIRLLSAAAMQSVFKDIAAEFETASGHKLSITYATIGGVTERIQRGEAADFIIGSSLTMPKLVNDGKIEAGSVMAICKSGIGLVVPLGDSKPSVTSIAEFKQTLLAAKVLVYADPIRGGAAGVHIDKVLQQLGIAEQLWSQITLGAGGDVTEVTIAQGHGAVGMTQISEIVGKSTAQYVGPFPAELQNDTVFVGGVPTGSKPSDATAMLVRFLQSPVALAAIKSKGMQVD